MCAKCHRKTACLDSRSTGGRTRRRHECPKCHGRFTTYEIPEAEYKRLKAVDGAVSFLVGSGAARKDD